jgi:hypothetical protein
MRLFWQAGLNNGETLTENKFTTKPGDKSPWLQLFDYLNKNNLHITSLCLTDGKRTFNLPSAGKNPKFSAFANAPKPTQYTYGKVVGQDLKPGAAMDTYYVIEAGYGSAFLQLWVSAANTNNCWVLAAQQSIIGKKAK